MKITDAAEVDTSGMNIVSQGAKDLMKFVFLISISIGALLFFTQSVSVTP